MKVLKQKISGLLAFIIALSAIQIVAFAEPGADLEIQADSTVFFRAERRCFCDFRFFKQF